MNLVAGRPLRVLLVEDSANDAALAERQLHRSGFQPDVRRVDTAEAFAAALEGGPWDVLLVDYRLPGFSALSALALVRERGLDLPAIVLSGAVGEESAAEAMRAGAADFIRKDNWARLGPAIARELQEAANRRERRRAEEERTRLLAERDAERAWLRVVFDESPVGLLRVDDPTGTRIVANRHAEELFGRPLAPEGGIAQYVGQIFRPDRSPRPLEELATWRALRGERITSEEEVIRQPHGREVEVLVSAVPIRVDARIVGAVVAYQDVTRLRELERLRDEWNSIVAHDLRQPVAVTTSYAQVLQRYFGTELGERGEQIVGHILQAARTLDRMIRDLLDISRIETQRLQLVPESIDPAKLVREVADRMSTEAADRPIRVRVAEPIPTLLADPTRIAQVVGNLLSNAVKYGEEGTDIHVEMQAVDGEVEVAVTNRGAGISPEDLPRLFTRFYRSGDAGAGRVEGLGLGLYISKGLVEAHGGRIWAESTPGEATIFRFRLPVVPPETSPESPPP
jgi:PAS domain S-box-containing protein